MRLLRLRLASVRGVSVVQGPNEAGKTTLAEALDLLLEKLDSSTDRAVRALQPVGTDAGSEIEAELEAGRYRLRIFKRFNRNRETVLEVFTPRHEMLTHREAHERLREILAETTDLDLWRALRVEQGRSLEQAALGEARSLLAALDGARSAGEGDGAGGEREEGLFERARSEYCTYFTPARGQPTGDLKEAAERAVALRAEVTLCEEEQAHLDADVERHERLRRRAAELAAAVETAERERAAASRRLAEVERLAGEVDRRRTALRDEEGKLRLLQELAAAEAADAELAGRLAAAEREVTAAREAAAPAETAAQEAAAAVAAAREQAERASAAERRAAAARRRAELAEARARGVAAAARVAELDAALAADPVTEAALRALEAKDRAAERAEAALAAARAGVEIEALAGLEAEVGGERVSLAVGERLERPVAEPLAIELPERVRITVTPGRDAAEVARRAAAARDELAAALEALGVESFDAARARHGERRDVEAERAAADVERRGAERALAAAGPEDAGDGEPDAGSDDRADASDPETAARARAAAERALADAVERERPVVAALGDRRRAVEKAREVHLTLVVERRHAGERLDRAREGIGAVVAGLAEEEGIAAAAPAAPGPGGDTQLGLFRGDLEAPELEPALAAAERRAEDAREALAEARERLAAAEPEAVRRHAAELAEAAESRRREAGAVAGELSEVRGRLEARGERGLFDRIADARAELAAAERRARALERRAAAARKLYETLSEGRDRARASYGEPLRRAIEELARPLYGEGFAIELDDELRVARRTLGGVTLAIEQLSAGAREQLALLTRLACARLAAPGDGGDGGVPVVLDDALGHTDPERLRALGEVLARAAESCQVIVLTSDPERYAAVEAARVVTVG